MLSLSECLPFLSKPNSSTVLSVDNKSPLTSSTQVWNLELFFHRQKYWSMSHSHIKIFHLLVTSIVTPTVWKDAVCSSNLAIILSVIRPMIPRNSSSKICETLVAIQSCNVALSAPIAKGSASRPASYILLKKTNFYLMTSLIHHTLPVNQKPAHQLSTGFL